MKVLPNTGSVTVLVKSDHRPDTYIEARPADVPGFSRIEFVRGGRFRFAQTVPDLRAPGRIIEIARGERL